MTFFLIYDLTSQLNICRKILAFFIWPNEIKQIDELFGLNDAKLVDVNMKDKLKDSIVDFFIL